MRYRWFLMMLAVLLLVACGAEEAAPPVAESAQIQEDPPASPTPAVEAVEGMRAFVVVPDESTASYIAREELFQGALEKYGLSIGNATVTGSTQEIEGTLQLNLETAELGPSRITVNLPSLTTERNERDTWIRENALESNQYPLAIFEASEIQNAPSNYEEGEEASFQLAGDLTIREITKPVVFDVTATLEGDTIRGVAETQVQMTDFGFDPPTFAGTLTVENEVTVRIELTAQAQ